MWIISYLHLFDREGCHACVYSISSMSTISSLDIYICPLLNF